jgi:hypothetical protein
LFTNTTTTTTTTTTTIIIIIIIIMIKVSFTLKQVMKLQKRIGVISVLFLEPRR